MKITTTIMNRRKFLTTAAASASTIAVAGCIGGDQSPPPRRSNVFDGVQASSNSLSVRLADQPTVQSRSSVGEQQQSLSGPNGLLSFLSPVGVAEAKGRGAAGRGASGGRSGGRPTGANGWFIYYGGDYTDDWYENHDDEVNRYPAAISEVGIGRLGGLSQEEEDLPNPGPVVWDEEVNDPDSSVQFNVNQQGWYRVGAHLIAGRADHNFGWEAVDFQLQQNGGQYEVSNQWKVSPRI